MLYGLIGGSVKESISDRTHNALFRELGVPGRYVKVAVEGEELGAFLESAKREGFSGLSVTMPHKVAVMDYLDEIETEARAIGAVNTIVFQEGRLIGYNTDGKGALDAIEAHVAVAGKRISLIGRGGAARAIAYEAQKRGAHLDHTSFDILINATPSALPIDPAILLPTHHVMDINSSPRMTPLLEAAKARGCPLIFGYEMFVEQAVGQFALWLPHLPQSQTRAILLQAAIATLA